MTKESGNMSRDPHVLVADEKYEGQYVALRSLANREVLAAGDDPVEVMTSAKSQGVEYPVLFFVPEHDMTFVY